MDKDRSITIDGRPIGLDHPPYVIAEISANHSQSYERAEELVRLAKQTGADAVKLQTYTPDTITIDSDRPEFRLGGGSTWAGRTLYGLYKEAHMPWEWQPRLKSVAEDIGITLFSSPFDETAVDFLEELNVPAYKIASFENTDAVLMRKVASTGKPVIMSTGMSTLGQIAEAVQALRFAGCQELALLKCTSAYPAPPESMNLRSIPHIATTFSVVAGLSDHTRGLESAIVAVSLGAAIVEKHFIRRRADGGPDASFSLEPHEFKDLVRALRVAWSALGEARYGVTDAELPNVELKRSLYVVEDVAAGEIFTRRNVRSIRPGHGLHTRHLQDVVGKPAGRDVVKGTPFSWELFSPEPE